MVVVVFIMVIVVIVMVIVVIMVVIIVMVIPLIVMSIAAFCLIPGSLSLCLLYTSPRLAETKRSLSPQFPWRGAVGILSTAGTVEHSLQRIDFPAEAFQL